MFLLHWVNHLLIHSELRSNPNLYHHNKFVINSSYENRDNKNEKLIFGERNLIKILE